MTRWLVRLARWLVPRGWRDTVVDDLGEEARRNRKKGWWLAWHTARAAARLRLTVGGDSLRADLRYIWRSLTRDLRFAAATCATFALGIGATVAVLSVTDRILFRPLPYGDPDRLVQIHTMNLRSGSDRFAALPRSLTTLLAANSSSFAAVGYAYRLTSPTVGPDGAPMSLAAGTYNVLEVLQVRPVLGRAFGAPDLGGTYAPVLLTYEAWQSRFGSSEEVLGQRWGREAYPYVVVGVLPPGFVPPSSQLGSRLDGLSMDPVDLLPAGETGQLTAAPVARLRSGVSIRTAQAEVEATLLGVTERPPGPTLPQVVVQPLQNGMFMHVRPYAGLVVLGATMVLLMAAVNLSLLLLVRGRSRGREYAIRTALGSSGWRIVRSTLVESVLLCFLGASVALVSCIAIQKGLLSVVPETVSALAVPVVDWRIVAFTFTMALIGATAAAIAPSLQNRRSDVRSLLQSGASESRRRLRGGTILLAAEVAIGVLLVSGAAMTGRSLVGLVVKDPGFVSDDLYLLNVNHRAAGDDSDSWRRGNRWPRVRGLSAALEGAPGVEAVGIVSRPILDRYGTQNDFWSDRGVGRGGVWGVSAGAFDTLRTPVLRGRGFTAAEIEDRARAVVINDVAARVLWPEDPLASALGRRLTVGSGEYTVVGVVAGMRRYPGERPMPSLFLPITSPDATVAATNAHTLIRMAPGTVPDREALRRRLDERLTPAGVREPESVSDRLDAWLGGPRFRATLFGSFAGIGLLLTSAGLFALTAFDVTRRRFEIGVRMALGASAGETRRTVVRAAVRPVFVGAIVGLLATWWAAQFLQAFLFEVDARDPWTYGLVAGTLLATAVVAAWLPARRAARTDPAVVLRAQ